MRWPWQQAPLAQQNPEPSNAALREEVQIFSRQLKRFEQEFDKGMADTRALHARMHAAVQRIERKPAQEAAGPTIVPPEGVTPPPPSADRWTRLRDANAAAAARQGRAS